MLKLLQSSAKELRPLLVFLWAKIMAVDSVSSSVRLRWLHDGDSDDEDGKNEDGKDENG